VIGEDLSIQDKNICTVFLSPEVLPPGARELIEEAMEEYSLLFGRPFRCDPNFAVHSSITLTIPQDNPQEEVKGGTFPRLGIRFEGDKEAPLLGKVAVFAPTKIVFESRPNTRIFPDGKRYIPLDRNGNSKLVEFIIPIPEDLTGQDAYIRVEILNGKSKLVDTLMTFHVI